MSGTLNVAVLQSPADLNGPQQRLEWLQQALETQSEQPCDLVVLPELFQSGYHIGDRVLEYAEPSDGPFFNAVAELARTHHSAILYGYAERQGDTVFNSAQCIGKTGEVIGHHRKLLLPPGFEGDHFAPGDNCALFKLGDFTVGTLVCYDVEFPENLRHVALQGADLVVVPTALGAQWGVVSEKVIPTRAFENGVFICYANSAGHENGMDFYGGSCIVAPSGDDLERAGRDTGALFAQLERPAVSSAQTRLPYHKDRLKLPWV